MAKLAFQVSAVVTSITSLKFSSACAMSLFVWSRFRLIAVRLTPRIIVLLYTSHLTAVNRTHVDASLALLDLYVSAK